MFLVVKGIARVVVNAFFREITLINNERIPLYGPVIFVGNHNNQFVDASILLAMLPRSVRFLIADKSLRRPVIGHLAKSAGCIAVARPQDKVFRGLGAIHWKEGSTTIIGVGSCFTLDLKAGDRIEIKADGGDDPVEVVVTDVVSDYKCHVAKPLPPMPPVDPAAVPAGRPPSFTAAPASVDYTVPAAINSSQESSFSSDVQSGALSVSPASSGSIDGGVTTSGTIQPAGGIAEIEVSPVSTAASPSVVPELSKATNSPIVGPTSTLTKISEDATSPPVDHSVPHTALVTRGQLSNDAAGVDEESTAAVPTHVVPFRVLPRVDQSTVYQAVCDSLTRGDSVGIFPEGGSHDQLHLLPLKPGVAIMALSSALGGAEDVMIVPLGLNYYQAHKILSRAIIQVGPPILVPDELVQLYKVDRRAAVSKLTNTIALGLQACVVSAPDYATLKVVRLCVTLYVPESLFLPPEKYHILYHQFSLFFAKHREVPSVVDFSRQVTLYASLLKMYGISDHEVGLLKQSTESAVFSLIETLLALVVAAICGIPLSLLWGPLRMVSSYLAEKHRKAALANSKVKIRGTDVVASYKILAMLVLVPVANILYGTIFGLFYCRSWFGVIGSIVIASFLLPMLYYWSVRRFASMLPLMRRAKFLTLVIISKVNAWRETEKEIITRRMQMQLQLRELVLALGPSTHKDFMAQMERCAPLIVCTADSKRLKRRIAAGDDVPILRRSYLESREEIL